jgi:hypothetical protein
MAFSIDPNIPLQVKERDYGRGFDNMQTYQANALKLQQLRDAYDAEKADRLRQKQMRSGIQTDIEQIQRGTPAKYSPLQYQQTPQRGQMPYGMTGVLANERGQNMPQPKLFGEDILAGNFNLNREVVAPAQEGRRPTPEEYVQILAKQAMMYGDEKTGFEALKLAAELKKAKQNEAAKWGNNPTKVVNPSTMQPDLMITNDSGEVRYLGASPYEAPKAPKTSLVKTSLGYEVVKEGELPKGKPIEQTTQPRQPRLQQVTDATGTYILDLDTGETRPVLISGKPVSKPPQAPSGEESNAAGFLVRMKDATKLLDTFEDKGKPTVATSTASNIPLIGGYLERSAQTKEQQQYKNAALAWIRAKLRKESGAAIGDDEARQEYENYFPIVGDTPEVIEQKRKLRQSAMDEMRIASGKAAFRVDAARPTDKTINATVTPQTKIVKTREDFNKLKSGESYIAPDGKLWVKP